MCDTVDPDGAVENKRETAVDEQTGKTFEIKREGRLATVVAGISSVYLICSVAFLLWLLFDTWSGRNQLLLHFGYDQMTTGRSSFRLIAYVALGGALGATVDGIRSIVSWHSERQAYGIRFIWKDLSLPFVGAAVGIMVYVTVRGGMGLLSGDFAMGDKGAMPKITAFAVSALAGFSCWQVFRWLDSKANQIFSVVKEPAPEKTTGALLKVPDLFGKTPAQALASLTPAGLKIGATYADASDDNVGKVIRQEPLAGATANIGDSVDVTIGVALL